MLYMFMLILHSDHIDSVYSTKGTVTGLASINQSKNSISHLTMPSNELLGSMNSEMGLPSLERNREERSEISRDSSLKAMTGQSQVPVVYDKSNSQLSDKNKGQQNVKHDSSAKNGKLSSVFKGRVFCFSNSFPEDRVSC